MKIQIMAMGRPRETFIVQGVEHYRTRLRPLLTADWLFLPDSSKGKNVDVEQRKELEARDFLRHIAPEDILFLLDERGKQFSSKELSEKIYGTIAQGRGKLILLIGGPYGTSKVLQERADELISLSRLTFTHEMSLLLLSEQLYRAAMIHSGSKYHH